MSGNSSADNSTSGDQSLGGLDFRGARRARGLRGSRGTGVPAVYDYGYGVYRGVRNPRVVPDFYDYGVYGGLHGSRGTDIPGVYDYGVYRNVPNPTASLAPAPSLFGPFGTEDGEATRLQVEALQEEVGRLTKQIESMAKDKVASDVEREAHRTEVRRLTEESQEMAKDKEASDTKHKAIKLVLDEVFADLRLARGEIKHLKAEKKDLELEVDSLLKGFGYLA